MSCYLKLNEESIERINESLVATEQRPLTLLAQCIESYKPKKNEAKDQNYPEAGQVYEVKASAIDPHYQLFLSVMERSTRGLLAPDFINSKHFHVYPVHNN